MRTQIYEHRSGLKVVPNVIVADVEKIIWDINPVLSKKTVANLKESIRERLEKEGWTGEYRLDATSRITISSYLKGIGLCFQTGNVGRIYADLLKLQTLYTKGNMFLSSKIVTVSPKNQAERFCQGVRPLLNE